MPSTPAPFPPAAFAFAVTIVPGDSESGGVTGVAVDAAFMEVSGLDPHVAVEEIQEGGVNGYVHQVPGVTKHGNLVLKRGHVLGHSGFTNWASQTVGSTLGTPIVPRAVNLSLLGPDAQPISTWTFLDAWPVKWQVDGFAAMRNEVLIQTLELAYSSVARSSTSKAYA